MQVDLDLLRCYVSAPVARRFIADERPPVDAEAEVMQAATMMADIAGFTQLTNKLASEGAVGGERLTAIINDYFVKLLAVVSAHGGEVVAFAGDALVAIWVADSDAALRDSVVASASCATAIQRNLDQYSAGDEIHLRLRVGLGVGQLFGVHVGGVADKWFYVLAGDALLQAVAAVLASRPGEVLASTQTAATAGSALQCRPVVEGMVRVESVVAQHTRPPTAALSIPDASWPALQRYVPDQVLHGIAAGQGDWLAESRVVTVMFVKLLDISPGGANALDAAQAAMLCMQEVFRQFDGFINQILIDDKGAVIVGVFGAPPQAHEDDALRSVEAAIELQRALDAVGQRCGVGVTTGRAFVGPVGGDERRTYTVMGDVMNLSARLMSAAGEGILCDQATVAAVGERAEFAAPVAIEVKGWLDKVPTFVPLGVNRGRARRTDSIGLLAGRKHEAATIERCLDAVEAGHSRVLILEGEPGVGKSRLVAHLLARARSRGMMTMVADADAVQQNTPYFAWRRCMASLLDMDHASEWSTAECREHVLSRLAADDRASGLAPLLSNVLPVEFADTDVTRAMAGEDRSYSTRQLVARLIRNESERRSADGEQGRGTVVVLEDAHWFDSASWDVATELGSALSPMLTVIATRPVDAPSSGRLKATAGRSVEVLLLEAMSAEETADMICNRLGVASIPHSLAVLVTERAEGNPFFSEELVLALRDAGIIKITGDQCRVAHGDTDLRNITFPDTLHGVVTSRIDRLPTTEQLTIKVAAVIGRVFGFVMLSEVHPTVRESDALLAELDDLRRLDLTPLKGDEPDLAYLFKHIITQEVAYSLLPSAQRASLHRAVAESIETAHISDLARVSRDLAHHWSRAGDPEKAMFFCDLAGHHALRQGAYREAAESFEQAIKLGGVDGQLLANDTLVEWEIRLGEAYDGLSDFDQSASHFERALALRGRPMPRSTPGWVALLARGAFGQALNLARPARRIGRADATDASRDVAEVCRRLSLVYYHRNEKLTTIATVILGLNVAETIDNTKYRAEFYGSAAVSCSLIGINRLGEHYLTVGTQLLAKLDDPLTATWFKQSVAWYSCGAGGNWDRAQTMIDEALEIARAAGLRRIYDEELLVRSVSRWPDPFVVRSELWAIARQSGAERGDTEVQIWASGIGAAAVLASGCPVDAIDLIERALPLFRPGSTRTGYVKVYGTLCLAYLRAGRRNDAIDATHRALQAVQEASPILVSMFDGYANTVETCLELWSEGDDSWAQPSRSALKSLRSLARPFNVARPRTMLFAGRIHLIKGHPRRAMRSWRHALELATRLDMPYEVGRSRAELGLLLHARGKQHEGARHLEQARLIFEHLGAQFDLERITPT